LLKEPLKEEGLTYDPNGNPMTGSQRKCCCYKWLTFVHLIATLNKFNDSYDNYEGGIVMQP